MTALVTGLFLAAISALTFIAYQHPRRYARLYPWVMGLLMVCFMVMAAWEFGRQSGLSFALASLPPDATAPDLTIKPFLDPLIGGLALIGMNLYLTFLLFLDRILGTHGGGGD